MSRTVYRISIVLNACWLLATSPAGAADPPSGASDDFDRWIPSIALTIGFTTQVHEGTVDSCQERVVGFFGQTVCDHVLLPERVAADDQKNFTTLQVGGTLELQTPQLLPYKWSPRIFIGGEILNVSAQKRTIAREGNPSKLVEPANLRQFGAGAILGQGSATTSDADTVLYGASLGVSIPVRIGDWRVSIKPSGRYLYQEIHFTGVVLNARRLGPPFGTGDPTDFLELRADDSLDIHAFGPGLEIEVDAARVGSVVASVFISGGAYRVFSDRRTSFSKSGRNSEDTDNFEAHFTAEIDPWIYRANLGFRVKWLGFSSGWLGRGH